MYSRVNSAIGGSVGAIVPAYSTVLPTNPDNYFKNTPPHLTFQNLCYINRVGSLHGKLTVTANFAPGCPATPWRIRLAGLLVAPSRRLPLAG